MAIHTEHIGIIQPDINQSAIPEPYRTFIEERARFIAGQLERLELPNVALLPKPMSKTEANQLGIDDGTIIIGGIFPEGLSANKHNLHIRVAGSEEHEDLEGQTGYSEGFAAAVQQAVLPGFTVCTYDEFAQARQQFLENGIRGLRLKNPAESDIQGQANLKAEDDMSVVLEAFGRDLGYDEDVGTFSNGLVVEPLIEDPRTTVIGLLDLGELGEYTYLGSQNEINNPDGGQQYGGGTYRLYRGSPESLLGNLAEAEDSTEKRALEKALAVDSVYREFGVRTNARVYDHLSGKVSKSDGSKVEMDGIVDPSFRTAGSTAGALLAIQHLMGNPGLQSVSFSTDLTYSPGPVLRSGMQEMRAREQDALQGIEGGILPTMDIVIDHDDLMIIIKLLEEQTHAEP